MYYSLQRLHCKMTRYSNFFSFQCTLYDPCWNNSACLNTAPGYQCLACPHGFYSGTYEDGLSINDTVRVFELRNEVLSPIQDQTCVDINECLTNNGGCDPNAPCVNTIVSSSIDWLIYGVKRHFQQYFS
jgi:hypothetical protein